MYLIPFLLFFFQLSPALLLELSPMVKYPTLLPLILLGQWPLSLVTLGLVEEEIGQEHVTQVEYGVGHLQCVMVSCCCSNIIMHRYNMMQSRDMFINLHSNYFS